MTHLVFATSLGASFSESSFWMPLAANVFVQLTVIVAISWVADRTLARWNPSLRHAIWLTALALALGSPLLAMLLARQSSITSVPAESPIPVVTVPESEHNSIDATVEAAQQPVPPAKVAVAEPAEQPTVEAPPSSPRPSAMRTARTERVDPPPPPAVRATEAAGVSWIEIFRFGGLLWAVGAALLLARLVWGSLAVARLQSSLRPPETIPPSGVLDRVRRTLGREKLPAILESSCLRTPACVGFIKPAVVVPAGLLTTLDETAIHDVIAHEAAHALRRDPLVGLLQRIAQALFWNHPLIYLLNARLSRAREEVCDNHVLRGTAPASYAKTLLAVQHVAGLTRGMIAPVGMLPAGWHLARRVEDLLSDQRSLATRPRFWRAALAAVVLGGVAVATACSGPATRTIVSPRPAGEAKADPFDAVAARVPCDMRVRTFPIAAGPDGSTAIGARMTLGVYPPGIDGTAVTRATAAVPEADRPACPEWQLLRHVKAEYDGDAKGLTALYADDESAKYAIATYSGATAKPAPDELPAIHFVTKAFVGPYLVMTYHRGEDGLLWTIALARSGSRWAFVKLPAFTRWPKSPDTAYTLATSYPYDRPDLQREIVPAPDCLVIDATAGLAGPAVTLYVTVQDPPDYGVVAFARRVVDFYSDKIAEYTGHSVTDDEIRALWRPADRQYLGDSVLNEYRHIYDLLPAFNVRTAAKDYLAYLPSGESTKPPSLKIMRSAVDDGQRQLVSGARSSGDPDFIVDVLFDNDRLADQIAVALSARAAAADTLTGWIDSPLLKRKRRFTNAGGPGARQALRLCSQHPHPEIKPLGEPVAEGLLGGAVRFRIYRCADQPACLVKATKVKEDRLWPGVAVGTELTFVEGEPRFTHSCQQVDLVMDIATIAFKQVANDPAPDAIAPSLIAPYLGDQQASGAPHAAAYWRLIERQSGWPQGAFGHTMTMAIVHELQSECSAILVPEGPGGPGLYGASLEALVKLAAYDGSRDVQEALAETRRSLRARGQHLGHLSDDPPPSTLPADHAAIDRAIWAIVSNVSYVSVSEATAAPANRAPIYQVPAGAGTAAWSIWGVGAQTFPVLDGPEDLPAIATTLGVGSYPHGTSDLSVSQKLASVPENTRRMTPEFQVAREYQSFKAGDVPGIVALYADERGRKWAAENYGRQDPAKSSTSGVRYLYKTAVGGVVGISYVETLKPGVKGIDMKTGDPDLSNVTIPFYHFLIPTKSGYQFLHGDRPDAYALDAFGELTAAYPFEGPAAKRQCDIDADMTAVSLTIPKIGDDNLPPQARTFPIYVRIRTTASKASQSFVKKVAEAFRDGSEAAIGGLFDAASKKDLSRMFMSDSQYIQELKSFYRSAGDVHIAFAVEGQKVQYIVLYDGRSLATAPATSPLVPQNPRLILLRCSVKKGELHLTTKLPEGADAADRLLTTYDSADIPKPSQLVSMMFGKTSASRGDSAR